MKRLLVSLLFLLTFSSSVDADPLKNILKHTLKGGTKEVLKNELKDSNSWTKIVWEKRLTDNSKRNPTTITIEYDSFTNTKTCKTRPFLPRYIQVEGFDVFMWSGRRKGRIGAGDINSKTITIYNGKYDSIEVKFDNKDKIYQLGVMDAESITYSKWRKYKKLKTRNTVRKFYIKGREGGGYTKTEAVYLKRLDEYLNAAKKYNCKAKFANWEKGI